MEAFPGKGRRWLVCAGWGLFTKCLRYLSGCWGNHGRTPPKFSTNYEVLDVPRAHAFVCPVAGWAPLMDLGGCNRIWQTIGSLPS